MLNRGQEVLVVGNKSRFPIFTCANLYCLYISANLLENLGKSSSRLLLALSLWHVHNTQSLILILGGKQVGIQLTD